MCIRYVGVGPKSAEVLQTHTSHDLSTLYFGQAAYMDVKGVQCHVARGGYTGEDGFEVRSPAHRDRVSLHHRIG